MIDPHGDYKIINMDDEQFDSGNYINYTSSNNYNPPILNKCTHRTFKNVLTLCLNKFFARATRIVFQSFRSILSTLFFLVFVFFLLWLLYSENSRLFAGKMFPTEVGTIKRKEMPSLLREPELHFFKKRIVHIDLKGAAPQPKFLLELFPFLSRLGFNGILMEYEDMFPYNGSLSMLPRSTAYSASTIQLFEQQLDKYGLELIPLVQTFGHMEFVLKHEEYSDLRERTSAIDTICPSNNRSIWLIREMISQIRKLHKNINSIHIGADEAWYVGEEQLCLEQLKTTFGNSRERLKLDHITKIARIAKIDFSFERVYAWNDMFDKTSVELLNEFNIGNLLIPIVWGYARDVTAEDYFPNGLFERLSQVFREILFAGAFKGANGIKQQFSDSERYLENLASYKKLFYVHKNILSDNISGIVLTGWSRYAHVRPLCELLPTGLPALAAQAFFLTTWNDQYLSNQDVAKQLKAVKEFLQCPADLTTPEIITNRGSAITESIDTIAANCQFPGADLYKELEAVRVFLKQYDLMNENECSKNLHADETPTKITNIEETSKISSLMQEKQEFEKEYEQKIRTRIESHLTKYFFEDSVSEWIAQHKVLCSFKNFDNHTELRYESFM